MDRDGTGSVLLEESNLEKCWLVVSLLRAKILLSVQIRSGSSGSYSA